MRRDSWVAVALMGWLTRGAVAGPGRRRRRSLAAACPGRRDLAGAAGVLTRVSPMVRAQTLVVVAFATVVEYVFSPRSRSTPTASTTCRRSCRRGTAWSTCRPARSATRRSSSGTGGPPSRRCSSLGGALGGVRRAAGRPTATCSAPSGSLCLAVFLLFGPSQPVYVGAFVAVSWLELVGTHLGTWAWAAARPDRLGVDRQPAVAARRAATAGSTWPGCSPRRPAAPASARGHVADGRRARTAGRRRALRSCSDPCRRGATSGSSSSSGSEPRNASACVVQLAVGGQRVAAERARRCRRAR